MHALDGRYKKFTTFTNSKTRNDVSLVFFVKDRHCFPITDERLKLVGAKANQGGCDDLLKHMADLKWSRRLENVNQFNTID